MLRRLVGSDTRSRQTKHFLNLLRCVLLAASEDVGFLTLAIADLMNSNVGAISDETDESVGWQ